MFLSSAAKPTCATVMVAENRVHLAYKRFENGGLRGHGIVMMLSN